MASNIIALIFFSFAIINANSGKLNLSNEANQGIAKQRQIFQEFVDNLDLDESRTNGTFTSLPWAQHITNQALSRQKQIQITPLHTLKPYSQSYQSFQSFTGNRSQKVKQSQAQQSDLCNSNNTDPDSGICTIQNKTIIFESEFVYENNNISSLILDNSLLKCSQQFKESSLSCSITIKLYNPNYNTSIGLFNNSGIEGSQILIFARTTNFIIDNLSYISTNGRSLSTLGSDPNQQQGASYIGQGGSCSQNNLSAFTYGTFDMKPDIRNIFDSQSNTLIGSIGNMNPIDQSTGGGGRIHIDVDSLTLIGNGTQIQANGLPLEDKEDDDDLNGGSGGYIYVRTFNKILNNSVSEGAQIQAVGGFGKNKGFGGAGGVIIFAGYFKEGMANAHVYGGLSGTYYNTSSFGGCGNAAAGTIFWEKNDILFIGNKGQQTNKSTQLKATLRNQTAYPNQYLIVENLFCQDAGNVNINDSNLSSILFPTVIMIGTNNIIFNFSLTKDLTVKYKQHFQVSENTLLDFSQIAQSTRFESIETSKLYNSITLGRIIFQRKLNIKVPSLVILNDFHDPFPDTLDIYYGSIELFADYLVIERNVKIVAPRIFLFANKSITIAEGSQLRSQIQNECASVKDGNLGLYQCFPQNFIAPQITLDQIIAYYNFQYGLKSNSRNYASKPTDLLRGVLNKWSIYILSLGSIKISTSQIAGPRVGLCSNVLHMTSSTIDSSGKGCNSDQGIGAGIKARNCQGSGASHGGDGGYGGSELRNAEAEAICRNASPQSYYFGKEARYEGSGGASGDVKQTTGGKGGGIVWVGTPGTFFFRNSSIKADGLSGRVDEVDQFGSGGGSGGSVQLTLLNLAGDSSLSAVGGDGSSNGGGGGAGGRIVMAYIKSYLKRSRKDIGLFYWNGTADVSGGRNGLLNNKLQAASPGQNGTIFHSKCPPGYSGTFCSPCEIGFYKYDYSYGQCLPCQSKPQDSYYTDKAEDSSLCEYECNRLRERKSANPDCLDPISLEFQRLGGTVPFFVIVLVFIEYALLIYVLLSCKVQKILKETKSLSSVIYQTWDNYNQTELEKHVITEENYSLKDSQIWNHTYRMNLIGSNSIMFPWFIPLDFPKQCLKKEDIENFRKFTQEYNPKLNFCFYEKWSFLIIVLLYPPLAPAYHLFLRKRKFQQLQIALYRHFPPQFWADKGNNRSMRLSCSEEDYQLAYIDFLDFQQSKDNWPGLQIPMNILLSGSGTYNNPYSIEFINDPYAKSLVFLKFDFFNDKFPIFFQNFNSQLNKLSFYKLESKIAKDLSNTVAWIENANQAWFNHFDIKCLLYIIENTYKTTESGELKQKRKSLPLESFFIDVYPEMFMSIIKYIKAKQISGKSEIRLLLVFKTYEKQKQIQTQMRIKIQSYQDAIQKKESILFDEAQDEKEKEKVSESGDQSSEKKQDLSEGQKIVSNSNKKRNFFDQQQLVDKRFKAFSVSLESSKAFELAIRQKRQKCNHKLSTFRQTIYSLYLLIIKQYGSPTSSKDINMYILLYSLLVSIDFVLLFSYTMHILTPASNYIDYNLWVFIWFYFAVPYVPPVLAISSAFTGKVSTLKTMSAFNSIMILVNIPLAAMMTIFSQDDPIFLPHLLFIIFSKFFISVTSAKLVCFFVNPNFTKNKQKLKKILQRQKERYIRMEGILGSEALGQLNGVNYGQRHLSPQKQRNIPFDQRRASFSSIGSVDTEKLRDKLLE